MPIVHAKDKDEGFNGRWVLDKNNPRPGDAPNNLETRIKQDGSGLTIESTFREPDNGIVPLVYVGVMTTKMRLALNGDQENIVGPFTITSKSTINGNELLTDWTAVIQGDQVQGHWKHTLAPDGRHMTLEIQESSTQGHNAQATLYFVRK